MSVFGSNIWVKAKPIHQFVDDSFKFVRDKFNPHMELKTEILIGAPASKVWAILTDFDAYGDWNPFVKRVKGEISVGSNIEVLLTPPSGNAMSFKPIVKVFEKEREFRWKGKLFMPGLFDGEHRFELIAQSKNQTLFIHAEKFSGLLVPLLKARLQTSTKAGFEAMNEAIKKRAEL